MPKIELYTWGQCPFCVNAKELLHSKNLPFTEYSIDGDDAKKKELYEKTGQNTVPYVFIDGKLVGGYSELKQLDEEGKL